MYVWARRRAEEIRLCLLYIDIRRYNTQSPLRHKNHISLYNCNAIDILILWELILLQLILLHLLQAVDDENKF